MAHFALQHVNIKTLSLQLMKSIKDSSFTLIVKRWLGINASNFANVFTLVLQTKPLSFYSKNFFKDK